MKKIIGYRLNGTKVFEPEGIGCASILYCKGCGKVLASSCGGSDVYCLDCVIKKGIVTSGERQKNYK